MDPSAVRYTPYPNRPDYGINVGKATVQMWANYFPLTFKNPNLVLYIYDMTFEPLQHTTSKDSPSSERKLTAPEGKKLAQVIRCALCSPTFDKARSNIATDFSKILVSSKMLDEEEMKSVKIDTWGENESQPHTDAPQFQMTIQPTIDLRVSDLLNSLKSSAQGSGALDKVPPIIQALDIVLGHQAKMSLEIATPKRGKCFRLQPNDTEKFRLQGPGRFDGYLHGVRGFFASIRATSNRPLVNCNACCGAFYKDGPLQNIFAMFIGRYATTADYKKLEYAIQGLRVELTHLPNQHGRPVRPIRTIFGLARGYGGPNQVKFTHKGENMTYTVASYWNNKSYGSSGDQAHPVVNVGNKYNPIYVPAIACKILAGQMAKKKLDTTQTQDMIKNARRNPEQIRTSIEKDAFGILCMNNDTMKSFGISVDSKMISVSGRVLEKPTVVYKDATKAVVDEKARWNLTGKTVYQSRRLINWGIMRIARDRRDMQDNQNIFGFKTSDFISTLKATLGGANVYEPSQIWSKEIARGDEATLGFQFDYCEKQNITLLVIVLPDKDSDRYKSIKRIGDVERGISTVCVLGDTGKFYAQYPKSYFANVALKINLKLGGINHKLQTPRFLYKTTMVFGIDVTHPSPGATKKTAPSVAAMVASVDDELGQWLVDLRINTSGKEMVELVGPMLKTRLDYWKTKHTGLPENLLIYRDGVSESQYEAVLQEELSQLRNTCRVMYGEEEEDQPKITLIIVGKRHHTRFFTKVNENSSTNPECGTIVDTGVTEARNWDFFLQSHHALLGTARPAHYFVLCNEIFTKDLVGPNVGISDYLHKLTYEMCWLFGRSTGPVSIPPPVYYADLACERSRCYGDFDENISDTSSMTGFDGGNSQGRGFGNQAVGRPGPSNQGSSTPGSSKQTPSKQGSTSTASSSKDQFRPSQLALPNQMAGLTKKEKNRLFEEKIAASQKAAAGGSSSKAEGKKSETKAEAKTAEPKSESKGQGKKPESKPDTKGQGKKPESKSESKPEGKGKGKAETKLPDRGSGPSKAGNEKAKEETQSKTQGKKPESKVEAPKEETPRPKEKDEVVIHSNLMNTMFYI